MSEDEMTIYLDEKLYTDQSRGWIIKEINDILDQVEINQQYNICIDSIQNIKSNNSIRLSNHLNPSN